MDTFGQTLVTPNTQGENANTILKSEKRNELDALAETLRGLKINNNGNYESDSVNGNDAKGDPASDLRVATHTSDDKKKKVMDTSN